MKLSLKFRDENQNPLLRAKVPVTILGIPFLSGVTAGDPSDLSFSLRSNFSSGPSLSLSYHPTLNYQNTPAPALALAPHSLPFSVSLKSGIGLSGSHQDSPLVFTASFDFFNKSSNPSFSLHIKPQFGNFSLSKSVSSVRVGPNRVDGVSRNRVLGNGSGSDGGISDGFDQGQFGGGVGSGGYNGKLGKSGSVRVDGVAQNGVLSSGSGSESEGNNGLEKPLGWRDLRIDSSGSGLDYLSGIFVAARTCLPLTKSAVVNFRWSVNFPPEGSVFGSRSRSALPMLMVNKVSLERVEEVKKVEKVDEGKMGDLELLKGMCSWMSREVEDLRRDNREMRQVLEGMKVSVPSFRGGRGDERGGGAKKAGTLPGFDNSSKFERWSRKGNGSGTGEENGNKESKKSSNNSKMSEVENELQKAIKNATS